jgi:hypothetical protein
MPLMVGGARYLREENNALIPVTYMPYRPLNSPTPSRHLSRRPVGSPRLGELVDGRNFHASEVDGSNSGNEGFRRTHMHCWVERCTTTLGR